MTYTHSTFTHRMGLILIDIFDEAGTCALTLTTEFATENVALYYNDIIWRTEATCGWKLDSLAVEIARLIMAVELPVELRRYALLALKARFPNLLER